MNGSSSELLAKLNNDKMQNHRKGNDDTVSGGLANLTGTKKKKKTNSGPPNAFSKQHFHFLCVYSQVCFLKIPVSLIIALRFNRF